MGPNEITLKNWQRFWMILLDLLGRDTWKKFQKCSPNDGSIHSDSPWDQIRNKSPTKQIPRNPWMVDIHDKLVGKVRYTPLPIGSYGSNTGPDDFNSTTGPLTQQPIS